MGSRLFDFLRGDSFARLEEVAASLNDEEAERRALGALLAASAADPGAPYRAATALGCENPWLFDDANRAAIFQAILKVSATGDLPTAEAIRRELPHLDTDQISQELIPPARWDLVVPTISETLGRLDEMRLRRVGLLLGWWLADDSCNLAVRDPLRTVRRFAEMLATCLEQERPRREAPTRRSGAPEDDPTGSMGEGDHG